VPRPGSQRPGVAALDGVLVVDKPRGITSHDVVARVRRILRTKRVGHVGTLDPMATGVLPLVLDRATRLASFLSAGDKVYHAVIRLGVTTDTYDATGTVIEAGSRVAGPTIDRAAVESVATRFTGTFLQTPPPYSAKKIRGVRAYKLARKKMPVTPEPVEVVVRAFDIETLEDTKLSCRVTCAPGFYMRSLAHDLGNALGVGGCLEQLRREQSGSFSLADAVSLDSLELDHDTAPSHIVPIGELLPNLPRVVVTEQGAGLAAHGNTLMKSDFQPDSDRSVTGKPGEPAPVRVYDCHGTLLAIAEERAAGILHPRIVLV
jgi:tRNA pseudouridine55 synthase